MRNHKLTIEKGTERKRSERSSTGYCICGWEESCSSIKEVRKEYKHHLKGVKKKLQIELTKKNGQWDANYRFSDAWDAFYMARESKIPLTGHPILTQIEQDPELHETYIGFLQSLKQGE